MSHRFRLALGAFFCLAGTVACSQALPPTAPSPGRAAPVRQAAPAATDPATGARLLDGMRQAFARARGFEIELRSFSEGHYDGGRRSDALRQATMSSRMVWNKPNKLYTEVLATSNPIAEGARLVTLDGERVRVRAKGVLGLIPLSVSALDPRLANNRNHSFKDANPGAQVQRLTAAGARWLDLGPTSDGVARLVEVSGVKRIDAEVEREVIAIEPGSFRLRALTMYAGGRKVSDHTLTRFRWDPPVTASTFTL